MEVAAVMGVFSFPLVIAVKVKIKIASAHVSPTLTAALKYALDGWRDWQVA
jgi:hypothetical protein